MSEKADRGKLEKTLLENDGDAGFGQWLGYLLPTVVLRQLAQQHDVTLKGFRCEKAPRRKLIEALVRASLAEEDTRQALFDAIQDQINKDPKPVSSQSSVPDAQVTEEEKAAREKLEADLVVLSGERDSALIAKAKLTRRLEAIREKGREATARAERERKKRIRREAKLDRYETLVPMARDAERLDRKCRQLEEENARLRDVMAVQASQEREEKRQQEELKQSEERGKSENLNQWSTLPAIPRFEEAFFQSLAAFEAKAINRILNALYRVCQDPGHQSLNFKKMAGPGNIYSVRAAEDIRLYLFREGRELRFLLVGSRDDQTKSLRLIRERYGN